ncbi:hypothetical protein L6164_016204 [Bauhinia variegata]|uniref:Uncharacterized protein n=1 Tax=Bauhinia variegata TaxID=167791 RepID=A0ACB9NTN5_BAUVA|nr:hypothetical protein L6164_016204 [Bauhinia variegata]
MDARKRGIFEEQEILTINVKPGWKKGTKITFEEKGNERPGTYREDIVFFISEKRHHLFRREGDDLELAVEIPLLKALTGFRIPVPLLGGQVVNLTVEDIVYPGYEKIITGQGMPISKNPLKRGNLKIKFQVEFPNNSPMINDPRLLLYYRVLVDQSLSSAFPIPTKCTN